jgi:hypothetical protein
MRITSKKSARETKETTAGSPLITVTQYSSLNQLGPQKKTGQVSGQLLAAAFYSQHG